MNYAVADFIIQVKNAYLANRKVISTQHSKLNFSIANLLVKNRMLSEVKEEIVDGKKMIVATLRYVRRRPVITEVSIISKPSLRVYIGVSELHKLKREESVSVLSTSKGVMTGDEALKAKLGGEYLFKLS